MGQLSSWERIALAAIMEAADSGSPAPTCDELVERCGCNAVSTTADLVKRLERRGLIRVERYQRSRRIHVLATGKATAEPMNKRPHWRTTPRPTSLPSVAPSYVQQRKPDLAREIIVAARHEGLSVQDFIAELVWAGWQARAASIQSNASEG